MKFDLHPHQASAIDMLRASLMAGNKRPLIQAPTGFGKTLVGAAIVEGALAKGKRIIFTVPSISLVDQTVERFGDQGISCGVMQGQHPLTDASQPVQIASIQTLMRRKIPAADIVLVDEAHRWFDFVGKWMSDPEWQRVPFVGLSATPWTKGLGRYYDDLIVAARLKDLIAAGYLSPFRVFAPSHPDLSAVKDVAGDYHEGQLAEAMSDKVLIADTVATWLRLGEDRPTLVFAVDRAHARKLAAEFEAAGVATGFVDMDTPREEREAIGQRLEQGQIRVVCNVGCLTTGVDWDVRCIVLARPTKSEMLFVQIVGRGLRLAKGKADCLILDHSDTTLRLGFVDDIHHDGLDDGKHQVSRNAAKAKEPPLPRECKACSFLKPAGVHVCPSCGFVPERQSPIEEKAGTLVQLNGKRKAAPTHEEKQLFYSMLVWTQREKGYKSGYAWAKFMARFKASPKGFADVPVAPDAAFLNWETSQRIAFAKSKHRQTKEASHAA